METISKSQFLRLKVQGVISEVYNFDMSDYIAEQREWSKRAFGPGDRAKGLVDHIRKELAEIETHPADVFEWVDVIILALDGAWRAGYEPDDIIDALQHKANVNRKRAWPDWRLADPDKAITHV